jgi:hypothetical protein
MIFKNYFNEVINFNFLEKLIKIIKFLKFIYFIKLIRLNLFMKKKNN